MNAEPGRLPADAGTACSPTVEPPRGASMASPLRPAVAGACLERCEYCGCSRRACGCEDAFQYEQIRDNPTLIAR